MSEKLEKAVVLAIMWLIPTIVLILSFLGVIR